MVQFKHYKKSQILSIREVDPRTEKFVFRAERKIVGGNNGEKLNK
jgi:hypothetical protein